jgi:hypothetical protein
VGPRCTDGKRATSSRQRTAQPGTRRILWGPVMIEPRTRRVLFFWGGGGSVRLDRLRSLVGAGFFLVRLCSSSTSSPKTTWTPPGSPKQRLGTRGGAPMPGMAPADVVLSHQKERAELRGADSRLLPANNDELLIRPKALARAPDRPDLVRVCQHTPTYPMNPA